MFILWMPSYKWHKPLWNCVASENHLWPLWLSLELYGVSDIWHRWDVWHFSGWWHCDADSWWLLFVCVVLCLFDSGFCKLQLLGLGTVKNPVCFVLLQTFSRKLYAISIIFWAWLWITLTAATVITTSSIQLTGGRASFYRLILCDLWLKKSTLRSDVLQGTVKVPYAQWSLYYLFFHERSWFRLACQ